MQDSVPGQKKLQQLQYKQENVSSHFDRKTHARPAYVDYILLTLVLIAQAIFLLECREIRK